MVCAGGLSPSRWPSRESRVRPDLQAGADEKGEGASEREARALADQ